MSPAFVEMQERVAAIAPVNRPVLLLGERGTGKELAAARLHYLSKRWEKPFIRWNCAACPPDLVESELFGHEAGSFTGALRQRPGRFEIADGGTLFLDELAEMPAPVQEKLLRVLEYGTFERVGGITSLRVDVRIVAATNADLNQACREGRLREDLLDRIACCVVRLPPLRARREDIPVLARHFVARMASELGRTVAPRLEVRTEAELVEHAWPGNIRELRNVVERATIEGAAGRLAPLDLHPLRGAGRAAQAPGPAPDWAGTLDGLALPLDLQNHLDRTRRRLMERALREARHHQRQAAALLGLRYDQFRSLYRRFAKAGDEGAG
jgi:psp operon transcriptional activator